MPHYTTLLFDLDGTISESAPGILRSVRYGLDAVGIHETDEKRLRTFIGPPLNTQMKKLYSMKDDDIVTAITKFRELYEERGALFDCAPYARHRGASLSRESRRLCACRLFEQAGAFCEADH